MSKKHNSILLSIAEVEYIAAGNCCTQLLWMQNIFLDYGVCQEHLTIYCDNTSAINISKNSVQDYRTKHIEIRHHFIWELVEDGTTHRSKVGPNRDHHRLSMSTHSHFVKIIPSSTIHDMKLVMYYISTLECCNLFYFG